jgi:CRP-like cAMP-binding protein
MSTTRDAALLLREMPLFAELTPKEVVLLGMVLKVRSYAAGDWICREGEPATGCYIVESGEVEVLKRVPDRSQVPISTLGRFGVFGHIALVDDGPRSASCRAKTRVEALRLERSDFEMLVSSGSPFAFRFQAAVARVAASQLREANRQLRALMDERVAPSRPQQRTTLVKVQAILAHTDAPDQG